MVEAPDDTHAVDGEVADILVGLREQQEAKAEDMATAIENTTLTKHYLDNHTCPVCKADGTIEMLESVDTQEFDWGVAKCECNECGATWREEWKLTGIYDITLGDRS
jgi:DNA-directed RNA polymerase subunit M/transcription elongation factor TFIIS